MWTDSATTAGVVAALGVVLTVLLQLLSALLERSGPIRLRHWAEEAEGQILQLFERPLRFEAFHV